MRRVSDGVEVWCNQLTEEELVQIETHPFVFDLDTIK